MWPNREHLSKSCVSVPLTGPHLGLPATSSLWGPHPWCLDSPPTMCARTFISDSCPQPVPPLAHTTHLTCIISFNSDISMRYYYYYSHFTDFRESSRIEGTGYSPFVCTFVENYLCKVWFYGVCVWWKTSITPGINSNMSSQNREGGRCTSEYD